MTRTYLILAINPGSTSTKLALYRNEELLFEESVYHPPEALAACPALPEQAPMREACVVRALEAHGFAVRDLSVVMGRGGLLPPVRTGGYIVNDVMLRYLREERPGRAHASNLGAILADRLARQAGVKAYIYDAVSASEFPPLARVTGMPEMPRRSFCHVLNQRAMAMRYARSQGRAYADLRLLVAHLGGGITLGVHEGGKIVDSLADDNGPFAPERCGSLPLLDVISMCYSGRYTHDEMLRKIRGMGGLRAHLGTSDGRAIKKLVEAGDEKAAFLMRAQAYQIAKGVGMLSIVLKGKCDAILLTGSLAHFDYLIDLVKEYISFLAPVVVMPGEHETAALAEGGLRILRGEEEVHEMTGSVTENSIDIA